MTAVEKISEALELGKKEVIPFDLMENPFEIALLALDSLVAEVEKDLIMKIKEYSHSKPDGQHIFNIYLDAYLDRLLTKPEGGNDGT